jgi:two-component system, NarL family, sensor kinase
MRKYLLSIFCLTTTFCKAQLIYSLDDDKSYVVSAEAKLKDAVTDSARGYSCFKLYVLCKLINDTTKANFYFNEGIALSEKHPFLKAASYFYKAHSLYAIRDIPNIEANLLKGDSLLKAFNHKDAYEVRAFIWHAYGTFQQMKADEKTAMDAFLNKAQPYAKKSGNTFLIGNVQKAIATVLMNCGQTVKATSYLLEACVNINAAPAENPTRLETLTETNIYTAENFVGLLKYDSAKIYLDKAKMLLAGSPNSNLNLPYYYAKGVYFDGIKEYAAAIASFNKGILLGKDGPRSVQYSVNRLLDGKFKALYKNGDYANTIATIQNLIKSPLVFDHDKKSLYQYLYRCYSKTGNSKEAFFWAEKYIVLKDSLQKKDVALSVAELEKKYTTVENEKMIAQLEYENDKSQLNARNNRLIILFLSFVALLLLGLAILGFLLNKKSKKLSAQKELSYQQQLNEIKHHQQLDVTKALLQGEERERKRLAGDLHDGLGGMLAGVKINLSRILKGNSQLILADDLPKVINQLDNSVNELRRIAKNMMPETLMNSGLEVALKDLCESLLSDKTKLDFQALHIQTDIPQEIQVTIYRIVQELLANAIRHADARNILVQCSQNQKRFYITVEDNGQGFDKDIVGENGIGLMNVKNRVNFLEGQFEIHSSIGDGTTINIEFDVNK